MQTIIGLQPIISTLGNSIGVTIYRSASGNYISDDYLFNSVILMDAVDDIMTYPFSTIFLFRNYFSIDYSFPFFFHV